ncbi:cytoskeleton-associated protein 5 [Phthorimaea operculella]|nr:cytoskeleton-associated protein 5 [Phthorimaea operculella]
MTNSSPMKSSLGELPAALASRLVDSNSKLAQSALNICEALALAMGSRAKNHVRTFFPAFFQAIMTNSSPIKSSLGELPAALASRLVDSNSKLAQSALNICEALALAVGSRAKNHVRTFLPAFFQALGDSKTYIRSAAVSCIETWCNTAGPAAPFEGEMVYDALKGGSPTLRAALLAWLAEHLPNVPPKSFNKEELSVCLPVFYSCVEDRAADVRKAAADCVLPFMLHLGYETMHKQLDKLKPGSKSVILAALDKARPSLPVQPLPPSKNKKEESKGVKTGGAMLKENTKKVVPQGKKVLAKPASASSRGKKDDEDCSPLLPNNNAKNQRIIDDQKLKVLKWNFATPREEFFELLKEQMTSAGFNKQLVANMFHSDFRYHLKAIEALSEDLQENGQALMSNLDLVLKWITLRFFDTNPSVILKGLEYLHVVFQYLIENDYTMPEYEANCFIPYLVTKRHPQGLEYLHVVFQYLIENDYTMPEYEANCFIPYLVTKVRH